MTRIAGAECVARPPTPVLSLADAKAFPSKIGPALSGPLTGLAWGMNADEARAAAPALVKAMRVQLVDAHGGLGDDPGDPWLPLAGGEVQLRIENRGLATILLRYPSRAAAVKALKAWKAPANARNPQRFEFWISAKGGMRGLLRPDDHGAVVEMSPFVPLATELGDGAAFAPGGTPLLGRARGDVCLPTVDRNGDAETFLLPASERSSGPLGIKVSWQDDKVDSYKLVVDYTYDRAVRDAVPKLLEKKLGKASTWRDPRQGAYGPTCLAYGAGPDVWACDGSVVGLRPISVWFIHVGEAPYL